MTDTERQLAPSTCDTHDGGTFDIGMAGGYFYRCGCVYDPTPGKVVDGQTGPWFRGMTQDIRNEPWNV